MVTLGTVTYKNQLTIPKKIVENSGLKHTRKVLIETQGDNIVIKPVHSSIDELAGSLSHLAKGKPKDWKTIEKETHRLAGEQIAKEGLK